MGIRGNYHAVSSKWLQGYLNEYAWRYNHRPKVYKRLDVRSPAGVGDRISESQAIKGVQ